MTLSDRKPRPVIHSKLCHVSYSELPPELSSCEIHASGGP